MVEAVRNKLLCKLHFILQVINIRLILKTDTKNNWLIFLGTSDCYNNRNTQNDRLFLQYLIEVHFNFYLIVLFTF